MKILHVVPSIGPARGGTSTAVQSMGHALADCGVEVCIATTTDNGSANLDVPLGNPVSIDGYSCCFFPRQQALYTVSMPLLKWLQKCCASYDLIHVHGILSFASDVAPRIARYYRKPYVVTPHGILGTWGFEHSHVFAKQLFLKLMIRDNLRHAAFVHYTSRQEYREAQGLCSLDRTVTFPLGLSFDSPLSHKEALPVDESSCLQVLFLARIDQKKGLELLLSAMAQLKQWGSNVRLLIAGDGDPAYMAQLRRMCEDLALGPRVEWLGFVSGLQKRHVLLDASIFVLASHNESFGLAPLEAMSCGLPVVLSEKVGIAPQVATAGAGLIVSTDSQQIALAIQVLYSNRQLLAVMGSRAIGLVREEYSTRKMAVRLLEMYSKATAQNRD